MTFSTRSMINICGDAQALVGWSFIRPDNSSTLVRNVFRIWYEFLSGFSRLYNICMSSHLYNDLLAHLELHSEDYVEVFREAL